MLLIDGPRNVCTTRPFNRHYQAIQEWVAEGKHNTRSRLIMEIDAMLFWNIILTMVVVPFGWAFNKMFQEVKRIQILLEQDTRRVCVKMM